MVKGFIHSIENGSMVDGPGVRFVIFMAGCPLRCQFCHNPDTWNIKSGKETELKDLLKQIEKSKNFIKSAKGGVTISGGEPLLQKEFLENLLLEIKKLDLETAVDTSGFLVDNLSQTIIDNTDLFLLDIKSFNHETYEYITKGKLENTIKFLDILEKHGKKTWIRVVLVPQLNDNLEDLKEMSNYLKEKKNIEFVEILPFHKFGEFKWKESKLDYKLYDTKPPSKDLIEKVKNIFINDGLKVKV